MTIAVTNSGGGSSTGYDFGFTATAGRILIAALSFRDWSQTLTSLGTWTVLAKRDNNPTNEMCIWLLAKVAAGGETALDVTSANPIAPRQNATIEVTGASLTGFIDGGENHGTASGTRTGNTVSPIGPSIVVGGLSPKGSNTTASSGWTKVFGNTPPPGQTDWPRTVLCYAIQGSGGSYGPQISMDVSEAFAIASAAVYDASGVGVATKVGAIVLL